MNVAQSIVTCLHNVKVTFNTCFFVKQPMSCMCICMYMSSDEILLFMNLHLEVCA